MARSNVNDRKSLLGRWLLSACLGLSLAGLGGAQTGGDVKYIYDEVGRLVAVVAPGGEAAIYTYDAVGNLLSISRRSAAQISVIEVTPDAGPIGGAVTIYGTAFSATPGENTVSFNGVAASVSSSSPTHITTTVPAGATSGPLTVTSPAGTATSGTAFTVTEDATGLAPTITSFTPSIASAGTPITITGTNFDTTAADNRVEFNVTPAGVTSATATSLTVLAPRGGSGRISVTTPFGRAVAATDFFVPPAPYLPADVSYAERTSFGQEKTVNVPHANTVGMLIFDGRAGQKISVMLTDVTANARVSIYKPDDGVLYGSEFFTWSTNRFIDTHILGADGTYTILVDPSTTAATQVRLKLIEVPPDVRDTIAMNSYKSMQINVPGQNGLFKYSAEAGQRVLVKIYDHTMSKSAAEVHYVGVQHVAQVQSGSSEGGGGSGGTSVHAVTRSPYPPYCVGGCLYTSAGGISRNPHILKPLGTASVFGTNPTFYPDAEVLPVTGDYYIVVNPEAANTGSVTVHLREVPPDETYAIEANGTPVTVNTVHPGRNVWLAFNGTAGQKVSLKLSNNTFGGNYVSINKPDGTYLVGRTAFNAATHFIDTLTLPATGTYKIYIDPTGEGTGGITAALYNVVDVTGTMTVDGPPLPVQINTPGQNARITFAGTAGQQVSLRMTAVTIAGNTTVDILNPDGTELVNNYNVSTSGGFIDYRTLPATGTYTIVVDPWAREHTGNITLTLSGNMDATGTITPGGPPLTVTTTAAGQNIKVIFEGAAGQRVSLKLGGVTISSSSVSIKNPDGTNLVAPVTMNTSGKFIDTVTLPTAGTYTIFIDPASSYTGSVTLTLYDVVDAAGTITPGGPPVTATTTVPGQAVRLAFDGTTGQRVSLNASSQSVAYDVIIWRPDGTEIVRKFINSGWTGDFIDALTLTSSGPHSVAFDPTTDSTGSATLTLYDVPPDAAASITAGGAAVTVPAGVPGQNAALTFTGAADQRVSLNVTGVTINTGYVSVRKPDGTNLIAPTSMSTGGKFFEPFALPTAGTYTIFLDPYKAYTGSATFTLNDVVDSSSGTITPGGPPVVATTTAPGQRASFTFEGMAGQRVSLNLSSSGIAYDVYVKRPDGTVITQKNIPSGWTGDFIEPMTLTTTGTHSILFDPSGTYTGSATLTLYDVPADPAGTTTVGGGAVTITTTVPGQNATLTFAGTAGQQVTVRVTGNTIAGVTLKLLKPDGTQQTAKFGNTASSFNLTTQTLPVTGTYTISIDPDKARTGTMSVSVTNP